MIVSCPRQTCLHLKEPLSQENVLPRAFTSVRLVRCRPSPASDEVTVAPLSPRRLLDCCDCRRRRRLPNSSFFLHHTSSIRTYERPGPLPNNNICDLRDAISCSLSDWITFLEHKFRLHLAHSSGLFTRGIHLIAPYQSSRNLERARFSSDNHRYDIWLSSSNS